MSNTIIQYFAQRASSKSKILKQLLLGELASEWLPVLCLLCAVSLALRLYPCGVAILSGYLINGLAISNFVSKTVMAQVC